MNKFHLIDIWYVHVHDHLPSVTSAATCIYRGLQCSSVFSTQTGNRSTECLNYV